MAPAPPASEIVMGFWHVPLASPRQCPLEPVEWLSDTDRKLQPFYAGTAANALVFPDMVRWR